MSKIRRQRNVKHIEKTKRAFGICQEKNNGQSIMTFISGVWKSHPIQGLRKLNRVHVKVITYIYGAKYSTKPTTYVFSGTHDNTFPMSK